MKNLVFTSFLFLSLACTYSYTPDHGGKDASKVVIEGDILVGDFSTFKVSRSASLVRPLLYGGSITTDDIEASFRVEDDCGGSYLPLSSNHSNQAIIDLRNVPEDRLYRLTVEVQIEGWEKRRYQSSWMPVEPRPEIAVKDSSVLVKHYDQLLERWVEELLRKDYYLNVDSPNSSGCYRWEYERLVLVPSILKSPTYEYNPATGNIEYKGPDWWVKNKCWSVRHSESTTIFVAKSLHDKKLVNHHAFSIDGYILAHSPMIRMSVRTIPDEAYRYLNALNKGSDNLGSVIAPVPGEVRGNIVNCDDPDDFAIGYISVCRNSSRIIHRGGESNLIYKSPESYIKYPLDGMSEGESESDRFRKFYENGFRPYDAPDRWVDERCINCELSPGGSVDPPPGWSE